jgi:hypothetical protein
VPVAGGEETEVLRAVISWGGWALAPSGIYFATSRRSVYTDVYTIQFLDLESGAATELFRREGSFSRLAVSPDEKWILFGEGPLPQAELMLMENFR